MRKKIGSLVASALALVLAACSGAYSGTPAQGGGTGGGPGGGSCTAPAASAQEHFTKNVEPALEFCRTCHVPKGTADVDGGDGFLLTETGAGDFDALRQSWQTVGGSPSRILAMASGAERHSGGTPWPAGSAAYKSMEALLSCFADPAGCATALANACGGTSIEELPLLGSKRGQHRWAALCEGKDPSTALPADPRTLITPGVNSGKAVFFNAYWEDCHSAQTRADEAAVRPNTCGEFAQWVAKGRDFLLTEIPSGATTPESFRQTWEKWSAEAPASDDEFERMYTLRYGWNPAPADYPNNGNRYTYMARAGAAGESGAGRLPLGMYLKDGQVRSGSCFQCHGGRIGDPATEGGVMTLEHLGMGNNNFDVIMAGHDNAFWRGVPVAQDVLPPLDPNVIFNLGIKQRGQNNAVGAFEILMTLLDFDNLGFYPNLAKTTVMALDGSSGDAPVLGGVVDNAHPLAHTQDTPAWWNMGSRPRKFFDAGVSNDSTRIIMAAGPDEFGSVLSQDGKAYRERIEAWDHYLATYFLSLRSPPWPGEAPNAVLPPIDRELAEEGAILFHNMSLWGEAPLPAGVGGNGSCASCHGVYSPRYAADPLFLESTVLAGIAANIVPLEVIKTDRARSDMLTPTLRRGWDTTYWAYPEGADGYQPPYGSGEDGAKDPMTEFADDSLPTSLRPQGACGWEKTVIGYQAPPLHGIWATAPYLHNGSVPNLELVLDSTKRPVIWRRQLQTFKGVTGFDQRLAQAYDDVRVGWKYDEMACSEMPGGETNCHPVYPDQPSLAQVVQNLLNGTLSWSGAASLPEIEKRLIFDTRTLGNGKDGHDFADDLTPRQRKAIIEYLKTL